MAHHLKIQQQEQKAICFSGQTQLVYGCYSSNAAWFSKHNTSESVENGKANKINFSCLHNVLNKATLTKLLRFLSVYILLYNSEKNNRAEWRSQISACLYDAQ